MRYAVGIDIGGTNTRVALVDENLNICERVQFNTICEDASKNSLKIKEIIDSFKVKITGVGVSCPGPLDLLNGIVLTPPNLKKWHFYPITEELSKLLKVTIHLENDANLACLGEAICGAGKGKNIVQFLTISTGIGSGFVMHQNIYQGAHGFAHEIANMILLKDGPSIGDLKKGSIESICSGTAITKRANDAQLHVSHAGEVNDLAVKGNEIAQSIMEDAKDYLASGIATIFAINDPDIIILGGSVALKIPNFIEEIEARVKEKVYDNLKKYVHIVRAEKDEDSSLLGAAFLALSNDAKNDHN